MKTKEFKSNVKGVFANCNAKNIDAIVRHSRYQAENMINFINFENGELYCKPWLSYKYNFQGGPYELLPKFSNRVEAMKFLIKISK